MTEKTGLYDYLDELDLVADALFAALRQVNAIDGELNRNAEWYSTSYARDAWNNIPNNIRAVLLALIYSTYMEADPIPDNVVQWRKDIYTELDEVATKPRHLRKVK